MTAEAWIPIIGTFISAVCAGYVVIIQAKSKVKFDERARKVTDQDKIIDRQEKQINRQGRLIHEQQRAINLIKDEHARCREENAEIYGWLRIFREGWIRVSGEVRKLGGDPGDIPHLPSRKTAHEHKEKSEFIQRTTAQNTELVDELDGSKGEE